jgi:hypothetical protein
MGGVIDTIVNVVTTFIGWLIPIPDIPDFETPEEEKGVLINKSSNNAQIPIIYGRRQVGITRVFLESSGTDNTYLYMAGVVCEGEVEEIEEIYIDDKEVTFDGALTDGTVREVDSSDANFYKDSSHIQIQAFYGTDNQVASSILTNSTNWTSNHRLRGVCYLAFRFKWNQDIFSSIPQVRVTVKGRKVYDPRTDTTAYSSNSALILLDYLRNSRYGKGLPNSAFESDFASFKTSADECETQITPYTGGTAFNQFETNSVIDTDQKVIENVKKLLNPMRSLFTYNNGVYKLKIEGTGTSVKTITADHVIGGAKVLGERKNNKYNRVIGTFVNPAKNWQNDTISFPPADDTNVESAFKHATMLAEDNGTLLEGNFQFPNVTNQFGAEALCEVILRRSRNQLQIQLTLTSEFLELEIGDIVGITYPSGGFDNKPFRVLGLEINEDLTVNVQLFEHQDNFYTFNEKNPIPTIADTILPNPNSVQAPSIDSVSDEVIELFDGSVVSKLVVNLSNTDSFADEFEVQYKESNATDYRLMRRGSNTIIEKYPVKEGVIYDIRARTINSLGVKSVFTTTQHEVITAFDPPDTVQNYSIDVVGDKLHHTFDAVTNLDLDFYEIRFTSNTSETIYANTTVLVPRIARPATSIVTPFVGTGKFFIKAVDKFGVRSATATSVVISEQVIDGVKPITTITEETAFTGTKTDCVVVDNGLVLDTSDNFDDGVGNVDDAVGLFDGGNNSIASSGTYDFDGFDFGAKFKIKLLLNELNVDHLDYVDNFDSQSGLFDSKQGLFDGNTDEAISSNVQLQIALSNDNVTFGSYQNFKAGDYVARAVKFRAVLTSTDTSATPKINNLSIKLLLPTVIQDGSNVSSGTDIAGKVITFDNQYYQTPTLTIIAQDLNTGDYFALNSKSASNFNIEFFDSGGNTVDRTFDYQAVGLGSQQ